MTPSARLCALAVLITPLLPAQTPPAESPTLVALRDEVHQLRLAIERSTLLGARTQISIQRIQTQEARVAQATQRLGEIRQELSRYQSGRSQAALALKDAEDRLSRVTDARERGFTENEIRDLKRRLEDTNGDSDGRAREAEAVSQLQTEQGLLSQFQTEMNQLTNALDQAIRQMSEQRPQ